MTIDLNSIVYPFDPTGTALSNKITGEQQIITGANFRDYHFIVPKLAPFFADSMVVRYRDTNGVVRTLVEGIDYYLTHWFIAASRACAKDVFGSISFLDTLLSGVVTLDYQTIGGIWTQDDAKLAEILADRLNNPRVTSWDVIVDMPVTFPVIDHEWDLADMVGMSDLVNKIGEVEEALRQTGDVGISAHIANLDNPHQTNKAQVGLGLVRNLPTATQLQAQDGLTDDAYMTPLRTSEAISRLALTPLTAHSTNTSNPHNTTAAQVGAYSIVEMDLLLADKIGNQEAAYDTERFDGRSAIDFKDWVLAGTAANSQLFNGMTFGEVLNTILAGKVADSYMLEGRTYAQLVSELSGGVAQNTLMFDGRTYTQAKADILSGKAADSFLFDGRTFAQAKTEILQGQSADSALFGGMTLAQVKAEVLTGKAADATLFNGMTLAQVSAAVLLGKAADSDKLDGKTYLQVKADILTGKAADSSLFDGRTFVDAKAEILLGKAADSDRLEGRNTDELIGYLRNFFLSSEESSYQNNFLGLNNELAAGSWNKLLAATGITAMPIKPMDSVWLISGGEPLNSATGSGVYLLRVSFKENMGVGKPFKIEAVNLNGVDSQLTFGYTYDAGFDHIEVYVGGSNQRNPITVTEISRNGLPISNPNEGVFSVEPVGMIYSDPAKVVAFAQDVEAAFELLTTAFEDLRAQVQAP